MSETAVVALSAALAAGAFSLAGTFAGEWLAFRLRRSERAQQRQEERRRRAVEMIETGIRSGRREVRLAVRVQGALASANLTGKDPRGAVTGVIREHEEERQAADAKLLDTGYLYRPNLIDDAPLRALAEQYRILTVSFLVDPHLWMAGDEEPNVLLDELRGKAKHLEQLRDDIECRLVVLNW